MKSVDISNNTYGRWKVIQKHPTLPGRWICRCACGTLRPVRRDNLCAGKSNSCGCLKTDMLVARGSYPRISTEQAKDPALKKAYTAWRDMNHRCSCPSHVAYHRYGGRGISVCPQWESNFATFLADMGPPPDLLSTLDRIHNSNGYSPSNCRWTTRAQQAINRSTTRFLRINGITKSITEWARSAHLTPTTLRFRLANGWTKADLLLPAKAKRTHL